MLIFVSFKYTLKHLYNNKYSLIYSDKFKSPPVDEDAKARLQVYNEIIETEKVYVDDLKILMDVYETPLRSAIDANRPIISRYAYVYIHMIINLVAINVVSNHFYTYVDTSN